MKIFSWILFWSLEFDSFNIPPPPKFKRAFSQLTSLQMYLSSLSEDKGNLFEHVQMNNYSESSCKIKFALHVYKFWVHKTPNICPTLTVFFGLKLSHDIYLNDLVAR